LIAQDVAQLSAAPGLDGLGTEQTVGQVTGYWALNSAQSSTHGSSGNS
jgi:hypothetical protein